MVFKDLCVLVPMTKVVSALEGLRDRPEKVASCKMDFVSPLCKRQYGKSLFMSGIS